MTQPNDAGKLIAHIHASQNEECRKVLAQAREQAEKIVAAAWRSSRRRVHVNVAHERELMAREETLAAARLHTAQRMHAQTRQQALLSESLLQLETTLKHRWSEHEAAAAWIGRACRAAHLRLPPGEWELVHGEIWTSMHESLCNEMLEDRKGYGWRDSVDPRIEAGLRVKCHGVVVDATLRTILDDRRLQTDLLGALGVETREVPAGHG